MSDSIFLGAKRDGPCSDSSYLVFELDLVPLSSSLIRIKQDRGVLGFWGFGVLVTLVS